MALLRRDLPWARELVRQRLGAQLRQFGDTEDFLHDAVVEVLTFSPRFLVTSAEAFRRILAVVVENTLRDRHEYFTRKRRDRAREQPLTDTVLCLDVRSRTPGPGTQAGRAEEQAWLRLALEMLVPDDREIIVRREWDGASFAALGEHFGIAENAARMRFQRALGRLADQVERLRRGEV
ncbi:MAG: sigma-70 family RNA polymerase sigma factor [Planctomycetes bacterium]|nr:sigma-70 family RNA polymerase sigma factor [Planctomycetota bacterium]